MLNLFFEYQSYLNSSDALNRLFTILILFSFCFSGWSQDQKWRMQVRSVDGTNSITENTLFPEYMSGDSISLLNQLNILISELRSDGYLLANLDSIRLDNESNTAELWIYRGTQFEWGSIRLRSVSSSPYDLSRFRIGRLKDKEISIDRIEASINKIIEFHENRGYPFATVEWDSIRIFEDRISASLNFDSGPMILYDSLDVEGDVLINSDFLASYLGVSVGRPYNRRAVRNIPRGLESLEYLKLKNIPNISFQNEEARIYMDLQRERANRFDAIIGFLPNEIENNGLLITGAIDLSLKNLFQSGKQIDFHWDRLQKFTQTLRLSYLHPNVLRSQLGMQGDFYLYKQDTTFLNRRLMFGLNVKTGGLGIATVQSRWESSRLISTSQFSDIAILPDIADYNIAYISLGYSDRPLRGLSYYSSKTWGIITEAAIGNKLILKNSELDQGLYSEIDLNSIQFSGRLSLDGIYKFPTRPFAIYGKLMGGFLQNDQLFLNDLFRLGGLNSIRGFNENTFYASEYLIGTVELQAYFNSASSIFLFFDQGHLQYQLTGANYSDNPLGTGLGLSLESGNGHFSLVYAFGKSKEQPLSIRYSKIHFGYKAIF